MNLLQRYPPPPASRPSLSGADAIVGVNFFSDEYPEDFGRFDRYSTRALATVSPVRWNWILPFLAIRESRKRPRIRDGSMRAGFR